MLVDYCKPVKNPHKPTGNTEYTINLEYTTRYCVLIPSFSWVTYLDRSIRSILKRIYYLVGVEVGCWRNSLCFCILSCLFILFFSPQSFIASMWIFQRIAKSQNGQGWKGCCQVTCSNTPSQAGLSRVSCPGTCPDGFCTFARMETP